MNRFSSNWIVVEVGFCIAAWALFRSKWFKSFFSKLWLPYPPGPAAKNWIAGNISEIPVENQWFLFTEWSKIYGDLTYFRALHQHFIVINKLEVAIELFEKRSNNYSSRPHATMVDLMGWDFNSGLKPYGNIWRNQRRLLQQYLKPEATRSYQTTQVQKIHDMLLQLLESPNDFMNHVQHSSGSIIMATMYGHDVQTKDDPYTKIAGLALDRLAIALFPGAYLVNTISALRLLPKWLPGCAEFNNFAVETRTLTDKMRNDPVEKVQQLRGTSGERRCIAGNMLENCRSDDELEDIKCVCATMYAGGADTTISSVQTFFYAMANYYDVQSKAQEEIDRVVGRERLPSFEDRPSMPYSEAIVREILRWRPLTPLGVAHTSSDEDIYEGYYIPKGTALMPNIWCMTRDPAKYDDPETFNPSRFFNPDGTLNDDDLNYGFGFGRRICPGRHFAKATVWLSVVSVLATFDIRKKKDATGKDIPVDQAYTQGLFSRPMPFECAITPRSEATTALLRDAIAHRD
ncbi:cytochrome P450 [Crepidotus variabilis]|uniref:Cytochrome P450 n=1 Tax=Crepidotus variabilis TaxID=179855 RepID=A0A9P6E546_9AGAR|nr:cytochrome P450 [Crepidotus variabilis]